MDDRIHGCLLFRPLPPSLDTQKISRVLDPKKDVDAITTASMGGLLTNTQVGFAPCTATACLKLLHYYKIPLQGKRIVVVGKSVTVGLPTALLMMNEDATVSVCHILTQPEDTRAMCRNADIIISAAGCANLIRADYVHPGQVVVDVGINVGPDGKLCGDVAFSEFSLLLVWQTFRLNARYGTHGLMKAAARKRHPRFIISRKAIPRLFNYKRRKEERT